MDKSALVISCVKKVYVAWSNTDLTEGRGERVAICACELEETAKRMGAKKSVMGSDCDIEERVAVKLAGSLDWLVPGRIILPSAEDRALQQRKNSFESALKKAKELGLTDDELSAIRGIKK